jgi:hypothetical protein
MKPLPAAPKGAAFLTGTKSDCKIYARSCLGSDATVVAICYRPFANMERIIQE